MPSLPNPLGPYRLQRKLGGGGFADVYLAFDMRRGHQVALKVLHPHHANSAEALRRFQREGEQMLKLRHQHIVGAYEVGAAAGYQFIAMPYLAGGSLADLLTQRKKLDLPTSANITGQVAAALDFVHPQVIHRDLKPSNVLLDGRGGCLVADFGVAHVAGESPLTPTGYQPGTPHYMAPEQVRPALGKVSPATDVWALGVILYEMLCGQRPFEAEDSQVVLFQVVNEAPARPLALNPGLPDEIEAILDRALAKEPRQRYQRAGQLARDVQRLAAASAPARPRTPTPAPAKTDRERLRTEGRWLGMAGLATLVILTLIVVLSTATPPPPSPTMAPAPTSTVALGLSAAVNRTATPPVAVGLPTTPSPSPRPETATVANAATVAAAAPLSTASTTATATAGVAAATATRTPVRLTSATPPQPLAAPVIAAPDDGFTADQGFVRFMWQAVVGAGGVSGGDEKRSTGAEGVAGVAGGSGAGDDVELRSR